MVSSSVSAGGNASVRTRFNLPAILQGERIGIFPSAIIRALTISITIPSS